MFLICKKCGKTVRKDKKMKNNNKKRLTRKRNLKSGGKRFLMGGKKISTTQMGGNQLTMNAGTGELNDTPLGGKGDPLSPGNIIDSRLVNGGGGGGYDGEEKFINGGEEPFKEEIPENMETTHENPEMGGGRRKKRNCKSGAKKMRGGNSLFNQKAGMNENSLSALSSAVHGGENNNAYGGSSPFGSIYNADQPPKLM
jgi:hypothetical protein